MQKKTLTLCSSAKSTTFLLMSERSKFYNHSKSSTSHSLLTSFQIFCIYFDFFCFWGTITKQIHITNQKKTSNFLQNEMLNIRICLFFFFFFIFFLSWLHFWTNFISIFTIETNLSNLKKWIEYEWIGTVGVCLCRCGEKVKIEN